MNINRKKYSLILFILFLLSRFLDVYATWYYSPNLSKEGNPIIISTGSGWTGLLILQLVGIVFIGFICFRLCNYNYQKKEFDEVVLSFISEKYQRNPTQRFKNEFSWVFSAIFMGFSLSLIWFLAHNLSNNDFINYLSSIRIGVIPLTLIIILSIGFLIGKVLIGCLIGNSLPSLEIKNFVKH